jgi:hypothetical protein
LSGSGDGSGLRRLATIAWVDRAGAAARARFTAAWRFAGLFGARAFVFRARGRLRLCAFRAGRRAEERPVRETFFRDARVFKSFLLLCFRPCR